MSDLLISLLGVDDHFIFKAIGFSYLALVIANSRFWLVHYLNYACTVNSIHFN